MTETFEAVIEFLEKSGLIRTARIMRRELKATRGLVLDIDKEKHFLSKIPPPPF